MRRRRSSAICWYGGRGSFGSTRVTRTSLYVLDNQAVLAQHRPRHATYALDSPRAYRYPGLRPVRGRTREADSDVSGSDEFGVGGCVPAWGDGVVVGAGAGLRRSPAWGG